MDRTDSPTSGADADAYDYYSSIPDEYVFGSFHCLDNPSRVTQLMNEVQSNSTSNFVVDFSDHTAWTGFNLSTKSMKALLDIERPEALSSRWINIWYPFQQQSILDILARKYDFSPRLLALMCSDPKAPRNASQSTLRKRVHSRRPWQRSSTDCEMVETITGQDEISEQASFTSSDSVIRGNLYKIASDVWHYTSVDFGRQFVCVGYNSLYGTKRTVDDEVCDDSEPLPRCTRVWTWLIICEDNTVISINEDPFPFATNKYSQFQQCILREIRRNLVNVFRSLSHTSMDSPAIQNPLLLLPIRARLGQTPEETAHRSSDIPGLLFYYLFENWHNSYTLITRKESRYSTALATLRKEMLTLPTLTHIDRLDRMGKELGVLRRHYAAYARIIDRLLEPITASPASLQNSQVVTRSSQASLDTIRPVVLEKESLMGVSLSSAARVRFKRLRDLIDLYALSEVEEYIKQKEAMVSMNFSLIAIKQSMDVDRLTRITLLLTKATFLFLPVSLSTAYFSTQLDGVGYSLQTYWTSFAVVLFVSWLALFLFGVFNGNVQTTEVLRGLWKGIIAAGAWAGRKVKEIAGVKR